jgi:hypothetical protein
MKKLCLGSCLGLVGGPEVFLLSVLGNSGNGRNRIRHLASAGGAPSANSENPTSFLTVFIALGTRPVLQFLGGL